MTLKIILFQLEYLFIDNFKIITFSYLNTVRDQLTVIYSVLAVICSI